MKISSVSTGLINTNTLLVQGEFNAESYAFLVDPAGNTATLQSILPQKIDAIVLTHGHFDHVAYVPFFLNKFPTAKVYIHPKDARYIEDSPWDFQRFALKEAGFESWLFQIERMNLPFPKKAEYLNEGDELFGWKVLHTPGHTQGSVCLYNEAEKTLISGDTLFDGTYGNTCFLGGSYGDMKKSLKKLDELPKNLTIFPGHGPSFYSTDYASFLFAD